MTWELLPLLLTTTVLSISDFLSIRSLSANLLKSAEGVKVQNLIGVRDVLLNSVSIWNPTDIWKLSEYASEKI